MSDKPDFSQRASAWLHGSDTGMSSEAIFHYMTLGVKGGSTPSDPSDLGRCIRLLEAFPEWKARMGEMAAVSADWAIMMPHWDAIVASFQREADAAVPGKWGGWSAPETYDMMHDLFYDRVDGCLVRKRTPESSS